jgi:hypothetical protein
MPMRSARGSWQPSLVAIAGALLFAAAVEAQSLADVARAEAERRKSIAQPSRVYTNRDLKPVRVPAAAVRDEPAAPRPRAAEDRARQPGAAEASARDPQHGRDESWWSQRMADARERAQRSRLFAEALQSRINALTTDFAARDDPAARATVRTQLDTALAELERVRGEVAAQEQAIADLEEEARRAGVPPGWIR